MNWTLTPARAFAANPDHLAAWRRLNAETAASPLLEPEFVVPLLAEFDDGSAWLASCDVGGRTVAMALLVRGRRGAWHGFQPSQQPVGMWLNRPDYALPALLDSLLRALPGMPMVLALTQCDPFLTPRPPSGAAAPAGARLATVPYIDTARVTVAGTFDDYWAARGKNLRANLKKQRARLLKEGIVTRLDVRRAPEDMARAVADYGQLESAGWKAQGGTAIHPDNAQGRFYRAMLEGFARRGAASVQRYWFGERLVAVNLCIEGGGANIVLKTTYDESLGSQYSPALLMREDSTRLLFTEGRYGREEFYGKVMEWHTRWTDEVRSMYHINCYRWAALLRLHTLIQQRRAAGAQRAASPAESGNMTGNPAASMAGNAPGNGADTGPAPQ